MLNFTGMEGDIVDREATLQQERTTLLAYSAKLKACLHHFESFRIFRTKSITNHLTMVSEFATECFSTDVLLSLMVIVTPSHPRGRFLLTTKSAICLSSGCVGTAGASGNERSSRTEMAQLALEVDSLRCTSIYEVESKCLSLKCNRTSCICED